MCEQYFLAHSDRIRFNDQDLLNALLYKNKLFVPFRWNVQDTFYRRTYSHKVKEHSGLKEALTAPGNSSLYQIKSHGIMTVCTL